MGWIAALAVLGALGALFYFYPKPMLIGAGVLGLIGAGAWGYLYIEEEAKKAKTAKVKLSISYGTAPCDDRFPLRIGTYNLTKDTVHKVSFSIIGRRKGYSSIIYSVNTNDDKIIEAGKGWASCWKIPDKRPQYFGPLPLAKDVVWTVEKNDVDFGSY